ncbi:MAG: winged helix-turn-helix transcriptional regulator, partial [Lachnospiraceae bacterium]|nr:winged helix-turn-helix transcriptional regulator [Lachnospiraceae bacterium]
KTSGKNKRKKQAEKTSGNAQAAKTIDNKQSILTFIADNGSANSADLAKHIGLSQARTRVLLSELVDAEKIKPYSNGRSRRYTLPDAEE